MHFWTGLIIVIPLIGMDKESSSKNKKGKKNDKIKEFNVLNYYT